jgi:hypothetical protein
VQAVSQLRRLFLQPKLLPLQPDRFAVITQTALNKAVGIAMERHGGDPIPLPLDDQAA